MCKAFYVDDILATADVNNKCGTEILRKVEKYFIVWVLGEPNKFIFRMEIFSLWQQQIYCILQQTYIDKIVCTFLCDSTVVHVPTITVKVNVYNKLQLAQGEPDFEGPKNFFYLRFHQYA